MRDATRFDRIDAMLLLSRFVLMLFGDNNTAVEYNNLPRRQYCYHLTTRLISSARAFRIQNQLSPIDHRASQL